MNAEKLLKTLPVLQSQLDALLEFDCTANDLTNGVINMAFMLLFRDLIRLFACYSDGIINLLGKTEPSIVKGCSDKFSFPNVNFLFTRFNDAAASLEQPCIVNFAIIPATC